MHMHSAAPSRSSCGLLRAREKESGWATHPILWGIHKACTQWMGKGGHGNTDKVRELAWILYCTWVGRESKIPKYAIILYGFPLCRSRANVFSVHFGSVLRTAVEEANITLGLGVCHFLLFAQFEASSKWVKLEIKSIMSGEIRKRTRWRGAAGPISGFLFFPRPWCWKKPSLHAFK